MSLSFLEHQYLIQSHPLQISICSWTENQLKSLQHNWNIVLNSTAKILRQFQETEYKIYIYSYMLNASNKEVQAQAGACQNPTVKFLRHWC